MGENKTDIINTIYQSILLASVTIGYSYLLKRLMRFNIGIGSPSSAGFEEIFKLGGVVAISNMSLDYLYKQGILPHEIIKM